MSTTSTAIYSNPLFATYSVYARNASIVCTSNSTHYIHTDIHTYIDTYHITALHTELDTVRWASKKLLEN